MSTLNYIKKCISLMRLMHDSVCVELCMIYTPEKRRNNKQLYKEKIEINIYWYIKLNEFLKIVLYTNSNSINNLIYEGINVDCYFTIFQKRLIF